MGNNYWKLCILNHSSQIYLWTYTLELCPPTRKEGNSWLWMYCDTGNASICYDSRRSNVSEDTLINTSYNDQPLNQISSMVSIKREPIAAQTVTATNAHLQLHTDKGASQSYGTHSGLGLNRSNISDYLADHRTADTQLLSNTSCNIQCSNSGQRLTREPLCELPTFDGSSNLKMFRHNFQEFCEMNGYVTEREVIFWLKQCFKGRAKDIFGFCTPCSQSRYCSSSDYIM